jgi:hypothetical protein
MFGDSVAMLGTGEERLQDEELQSSREEIGGCIGQSHQLLMGRYSRRFGSVKRRVIPGFAPPPPSVAAINASYDAAGRKRDFLDRHTCVTYSVWQIVYVAR